MSESATYQVHIPVFDGPFDLLLHLIRENQVDIYDIPIAVITDQYLDYLEQMKKMDLEIASSFLVMAATLLALKAKMLLPKTVIDEENEEETDIRSDLVQDLLEYMRYKEAAQNMEQLACDQRRHFSRPNEEELYLNLFSEENPLTGKTLDDLEKAFARILHKAESRGLVMHIEREQITLDDRFAHLLKLINENPQGISFDAAFEDCRSKMCLIVTFLALLEMVRQNLILISQGDTYQEIYLYAGDLGKHER